MESRRRFRFLKEIAAGGFGKVYLAEMKTGDNFSSIVAVKVLHGKWVGNDEIVMRSRDEARLLGRLRHRNIVRVEDLTAIHGQCAIVMEYLRGVDLKAVTNHLKETGGIFPRQSAFEVIGQIATALDAAFNSVPLQGGVALQVIHRDIKPSNAMVTVEGDVKVLDFGTARASFEEREAKTQALAFGSAAYMSPERLMGEDDTTSADIFSLGVTLYELLTLDSFGKIQIRPEKFEQTLQERIAGIDLSQMDDEQADHVRETLSLMLAYDQNQRPTAAEVCELMEDLAERTRDGGLKRFARDVVKTVYDNQDQTQDPDDPLVGTTIVEERSGFTGAEGESYLEDNATIETGIGALGPSTVSTPMAVDLPRSRPESEVIPPPVPLGISTANPGGAPPTPAPQITQPVPKPQRSGSKIVLIAGAVGLMALLLAGGGLFLMTYGTSSTTVEAPTEDAEDAARTDLPTGSSDMDWATNAPGKGGVILSIPEKAVEVTINNSTDFKAEWDGVGFLRLKDLAPGTYRTKVKLASGGAAVLTDFSVTADKTCVFKLDAGAQTWPLGECR
jgi:serine/threonine protein kinase